jgi:hypothetical protein
MPRKDVDHEGLRVHRSAVTSDESVTVEKERDVFVIVTKLFCPNGHNLVNTEGDRFDGFGGIELLVSDGKTEGVVELSPFHGDSSKHGPDFEEGVRLSVRCPKCHVELPTLARCTCGGHGMLRKLYLTPKLDDSSVVAVCDVWGCPRSRVIDENEILSEYLEGNILDPDEE